MAQIWTYINLTLTYFYSYFISRKALIKCESQSLKSFFYYSRIFERAGGLMTKNKNVSHCILANTLSL